MLLYWTRLYTLASKSLDSSDNNCKLQLTIYYFIDWTLIHHLTMFKGTIKYKWIENNNNRCKICSKIKTLKIQFNCDSCGTASFAIFHHSSRNFVYSTTIGNFSVPHQWFGTSWDRELGHFEIVGTSWDRGLG